MQQPVNTHAVRPAQSARTRIAIVRRRVHAGPRVQNIGEGIVMLEEFKKFALKGNVIDLAVGVIIGAAFGAIVTSLVNDIIMPIIGAVKQMS